ncbi:hypothetical protein SAMN05216464_13027 [Mucilaginibacter pineti]|uniref:Uncharacterized protein n=1 Tax=Mucilaginibacter pineti TaxID=1391627 RepID=A0A1G7NWJ2_9SPHI|nr:hypothetical protein SAMN05216464_13027 [Mucilaginibacter pineti]
MTQHILSLWIAEKQLEAYLIILLSLVINNKLLFMLRYNNSPAKRLQLLSSTQTDQNFYNAKKAR